MPRRVQRDSPASNRTRSRSSSRSKRRVRRSRLAAKAKRLDARHPQPARSAWRPHPPRSHPVSSLEIESATAAALLGAASAMVIVAMTLRLRETLAADGFSTAAVVAGGLLALAIGVRVPQRFAVWLCETAWRRFVRRGRAWSGVLVDPAVVDRPLHWLVLSVITLIAGVSAALLPLAAATAGMIQAWMQEHFVWSFDSSAAVAACLGFTALVAPLGALGLAISGAHHLGCRFGQWDNRATAWVLFGAGLGAPLARGIADASGRPDLALLAAALPVLVTTLLAAWLGASGNARSTVERKPEPVPLPVWSDRWPTLLRAGIVAVGGGSACAMTVWMSRLSGGVGAIAWMILFLGVGVLAGSATRWSGPRSIGGFGVTCVVAGLSVALGRLVMGDAPDAVVGLVFACTAVAAIGFATAYGRETLLSRVASRSAAGATILARLLVCAAFSAWFAAPLAVRVFGYTAALMMLALSLVALGGILIIHEPGSAPAARRVRLTLVFGSMAALPAFAFLPASPSTTPPVRESTFPAREPDATHHASTGAKSRVSRPSDR